MDDAGLTRLKKLIDKLDGIGQKQEASKAATEKLDRLKKLIDKLDGMCPQPEESKAASLTEPTVEDAISEFFSGGWGVGRFGRHGFDGVVADQANDLADK